MKKLIFALALMALANVISFAQENSPKDPVGENFYPPELIMENQKSIGLTADQEKQIGMQMKEAQSEFMDLNWKINKVKEEFIALISETKIEEQKAIEKLDQLLAIENDIKKRQVTLMIRIKNTLSVEQQKKLDTLK